LVTFLSEGSRPKFKEEFKYCGMVSGAAQH